MILLCSHTIYIIEIHCAHIEQSHNIVVILYRERGDIVG